MEIENYEQKYLKYKAKYQELKNSLKNNPEGFVGGHGYTPQDNTYSYSSSDLDTSNSEDFY